LSGPSNGMSQQEIREVAAAQVEAMHQLMAAAGGNPMQLLHH